MGANISTYGLCVGCRTEGYLEADTAGNLLCSVCRLKGYAAFMTDLGHAARQSTDTRIVATLGIPAHVYDPVPVAGWFPMESRIQLAQLILKHDIRSVTEIGSFLGLSAIWFAQFDQIESVQCVDQWMEMATHHSDNNLRRTLDLWDLPRDFFPIFRDNIMWSGLWHKVHPIKGNSHFCFGEVPPADLVYVDGDHSFEGCRADLLIYSAAAEDGTRKARKVICGDDYEVREGWGVVEATAEVFSEVEHAGRLWWKVL